MQSILKLNTRLTHACVENSYKTEMSEDDYWSNDNFYIMRVVSEGKEETLGGPEHMSCDVPLLLFSNTAGRYMKKGTLFLRKS